MRRGLHGHRAGEEGRRGGGAAGRGGARRPPKAVAARREGRGEEAEEEGPGRSSRREGEGGRPPVAGPARLAMAARRGAAELELGHGRRAEGVGEGRGLDPARPPLAPDAPAPRQASAAQLAARGPPPPRAGTPDRARPPRGPPPRPHAVPPGGREEGAAELELELPGRRGRCRLRLVAAAPRRSCGARPRRAELVPVRRGSAPGTELERRRQGASREQGRGAERQGGRGEAPLGGEQARAGGMRSSCRRGEGGGVRRLAPHTLTLRGAGGGRWDKAAPKTSAAASTCAGPERARSIRRVRRPPRPRAAAARGPARRRRRWRSRGREGGGARRGRPPSAVPPRRGRRAEEGREGERRAAVVGERVWGGRG